MNYMTHTLEAWMPIGATKPKDDIAKIAAQQNWQILNIDRATQRNVAENLTKELTASDIVVHQFPSYLPLTFEKNFQKAVQKRGATFILLIHDFEPLRITERQKSECEYQLLQNADGIVVHTSEMAEKLALSVPTFILGLFDYLTTEPIPIRNCSENLIFAGTLMKANWLKTFQQPIKVFGTLPRKWSAHALPNTFQIQTILPQDKAPALLPDGIGLVWDSDLSADTQYQAYQKLNSPHKLSLYLAAELPVIVPRFSPFATFITENKLGTSISDLSELPTSFDYDPSMAQKIGQNLRNGDNTKKLLQELKAFYQPKKDSRQ
ncbi:hypothetical protein Hs30E_18090 [Lactococcus hodotermopsidis]|uniref:Beta-1,6-galactofuranosyltransferase n=1 Tax=Pseudolactococcus hodotermopsidis TaxID=2709157 RepID=A0A6A0BFX7_9LACT|nr:beta-1,6-galactofuranosyltransferase [Lactococcus hodotermopsidis]GFH43258.1 hypothetical protein Hs30E_18090 [Lactococcus hodotermopsidis]